MFSLMPRMAVPVVPSDVLDLPSASTGGLLIAVAGNLAVTLLSGATTLITVPAGWIPLAVTRVWATGTTATGITSLQQ